MEEGFVRAVHTGTGLEQDIPLTWFDVFPGVWREAGVEVEATAPSTPPPAPAPAIPAPAEAVADAPAPEGDAA